ncbi:hypothetical protein DRJ48_02940 [Candidatus Woesearchaeota archaeon]|nr:MAG: hypothetical protein DRJ48_02940 [Candidatus Woesearchaeota archaeon]
MLQLVYSPRWFYGKDIVIDIVSIVVLLCVAWFSLKYYRINKRNKNYLLLCFGFGLMALGFLFKIITNFTIYYYVLETRHLGFITLTYSVLRASNILFFVGFLMYRILMLIGLYILYSIYIKQSRISVAIMVYLITVLTYFSRNAYYVFHITSLMLLCAITWQYYVNFTKTRNLATKTLLFSFTIITLSQLLFVFVGLSQTLYVVAELIQLLGYLGLFLTLMRTLKDGKKKRKE